MTYIICAQDECEAEAVTDGMCKWHTPKSLEEITTVVESPPDSIGESLILSETSSDSLNPIIIDLEVISGTLKDMLNIWKADSTYTEDNFTKFDKTIQSLIKTMNSMEKAINDKNILEIRLRELKKQEQDWNIAYFVIELIMQEDPIMADRIMVKLRRKFGSYDAPK